MGVEVRVIGSQSFKEMFPAINIKRCGGLFFHDVFLIVRIQGRCTCIFSGVAVWSLKSSREWSLGNACEYRNAGNDQIAFAPREIKRAVPVREFGIQVKSIPEFTGIGFRVFCREQPTLHLSQSMACWKKRKDALNPAECNNNSLTVISCLSVSRREYEYRTIGESRCYILLVIKHHDSRKSSRYFRDGGDVVYVVGRVFFFLS